MPTASASWTPTAVISALRSTRIVRSVADGNGIDRRRGTGTM